ncbi:SDR family NAD(P)-dependent oxidoreductase [Granulicella arctica]|uniref:SDR family NAD(P)-dependent oxidoreductase n=1 Tax=Granulicella arctica TaxID=940613 RepID=UPI0021E00597|nr:SDR family NAD(P)-dependent oxidoreductase [Granulicella arctica]
MIKPISANGLYTGQGANEESALSVETRVIVRAQTFEDHSVRKEAHARAKTLCVLSKEVCTRHTHNAKRAEKLNGPSHFHRIRHHTDIFMSEMVNVKKLETRMGQLAVVTGASSGIGYNLAKVFAENGFDLIIASHGDRLEKAETDFKELGVQVLAIHADFASYEGVDDFWKQVEAYDRPIDAIAINAGVGVGGLFAETALDTEINLVRLNVEGTVHIAKHVVQHMVAKGSGRILFTASIASEMVGRARPSMPRRRHSISRSPRAFAMSLKEQASP